MRHWSGEMHASTVHEQLTTRLLRVVQRREPSLKLNRELDIKLQHANFLYDVATEGAEAAIAQFGLLSKTYRKFTHLANEAYDLRDGLEELRELAGREGALKSAYDGGRLIWQRRYVQNA